MNTPTFKQLEVGKMVNLEFDMIGKYISKLYLKKVIFVTLRKTIYKNEFF